MSIAAGILIVSIACDTGNGRHSTPGSYRLVWSDEFDTDGQPDPANWNFEEGFVRNQEQKNPFRQPHYIIVNLAIGGTAGGDPSQTDFPARYEIDYVRVYQK